MSARVRVSDAPDWRPPRQGWLRDSIRVQVHQHDSTCVHGPDFAALNRAAAAEMALRQQEAGRRWEPADGTPRANGMLWCVSHGGWVWGCNHHPERVEPAGPGESTTDVARWSVLLDAAPIYPGLTGRRKRVPLWRRRLPAPPPWFRNANIGSAIVSCVIALQAPFIVHYTPDAAASYAVCAGLFTVSLGMAISWIVTLRN